MMRFNGRFVTQAGLKANPSQPLFEVLIKMAVVPLHTTFLSVIKHRFEEHTELTDTDRVCYPVTYTGSRFVQ